MGFLEVIKNKYDDIKEAKAEKQKNLQEMFYGINLPVDKNVPILLQKDEVCHMWCHARRLETKTITTGFEGASAGMSVRVAKGVTFRTAATHGHAVKKDVGVEYPGILYITNKRIIFVAQKKNFIITYNQLISVQKYYDGFGFIKENGSYSILINFNKKYIGAVINGAINNFLK